MSKKVNFLDGALVAVTAALLFAVCVLCFVLPQRSFSEEENRRLATWRTPSWQSILDGSFSEALGEVYRDQFPKRNAWIAGKAYSELLLGKRENNRILWGEDGYLMARNEYRDLSVAEENLRAVAEHSEMLTVWIPRSADVMTIHLPHAYPSEAASGLYHLLDGRGEIPWRELRDAAEQGTQVYYRTDHHLTTEGAYLVYRSLGEVLGYTPVERESFEKQTVSENFFGSADSASGGIALRADVVELFRYAGDGEFLLTDQTTGEKREGFYDWSALEQKDQYEVFLGGNYAHLTVEATNKEKPRLLLVKDSFANAIVPFLAIHFDLEIVDPRCLSDEVTVEKCDQILILQGVDTLATNPSLKKITLIKQKS
ncbi:MAG: hypothetical protein J6Q82_04105 [Clostridia bacterium]|nr:hypothetical protein [Clostridia bacterium]